MAFDWKRKYWDHKFSAKARGIAFRLSFAEWLSIWQRSGKMDQRGTRGHQYCMARKGDRGGYEKGNVQIITQSKNTSDAWKNGGGAARAAKIAQSNTGKHPDPEMLARRNAAIKKAQSKPAHRRRQSERMKEIWAERRAVRV